MEAKIQRHENSIARFTSIALLHASLTNKRASTRKNSSTFEEGSDVTPVFDAQHITVEQLQSIQEMFEASGPMKVEAFVEAFRTVGSHMREDHLRWWFRRIDADGSGTVDWDELATFLTLGSVDDNGRILPNNEQSEDATFRKDEKAVTVPATEASPNATAGYNHSDLVHTIYCHPRLGRYFTASQDGTVRVWDAVTLEFEMILHHGKWVTSICPTADDTMLFVAGLDRMISVYDLSNLGKAPRMYVGDAVDEKHKTVRVRPIQRLEIDFRYLPESARKNETMEEFRLRQERNRHRHLPDQLVETVVLKQMLFPAMCMATFEAAGQTMYVGLSNGRVQGYPIVHRSILRQNAVEPTLNVSPHGDFPVTSLLYANFFDGLLSTAADGSVALTNYRTLAVIKIGTAATPIYGAAWMEGPRMLATCGASRTISLWSASAQASASTLDGHVSSVVQLCYDAADNYLISIDSERMIIVWNMLTLRPLQVMSDYEKYVLRRVSAITYDSQRGRIVTASSAPVVWTKGTSGSILNLDPQYKGHAKPCLMAVYNHPFHHIVTADSTCCKVWETSSGRLRATISVDQLRIPRRGPAIAHDPRDAIVAAAFDTTDRFLLLGLACGTVLAVNIANFELVTEYEHPTGLGPGEEAGLILSAKLNGNGPASIARIFGSNVAVWRHRTLSTVPSPDRSFRVRMSYVQFLSISQMQHFPNPEVTEELWRSPLPTCIAEMGHSLAIGTDSGVVLLYGTTDQIAGYLGTYNTQVSIVHVQYDVETNVMCHAASNGRVSFVNLQHKNRRIDVFVTRAYGDMSVSICSADWRDGYLLVGDDEGYVYLWEVRGLDFDAAPQGDIAIVTRRMGSRHFLFRDSFRAHMTEVTRVHVFTTNDDPQPLFLTASTDCQARIFTLSGLFVGYAGAPWRLHEPQNRRVMQSLPVPLYEQRSFSNLGSFLPDLVQQARDPMFASVADVAEWTSKGKTSFDPTTARSVLRNVMNNKESMAKEMEQQALHEFLVAHPPHPVPPPAAAPSSVVPLPKLVIAPPPLAAPPSSLPIVSPRKAATTAPAALGTNSKTSPRSIAPIAAPPHAALLVPSAAAASPPAAPPLPVNSLVFRRPLNKAHAAQQMDPANGMARSFADPMTMVSMEAGSPASPTSAVSMSGSSGNQLINRSRFEAAATLKQHQQQAAAAQQSSPRSDRSRRVSTQISIYTEESVSGSPTAPDAALLSPTKRQGFGSGVGGGVQPRRFSSVIPMLRLDKVPASVRVGLGPIVEVSPATSRLEEWRRRHRTWQNELLTKELKTARPMSLIPLHAVGNPEPPVAS